MSDFFPKLSAKCCLSQRLACYIALLYPVSLKPNGFNLKMSLCITEQWKNKQWKCSAPRWDSSCADRVVNSYHFLVPSISLHWISIDILDTGALCSASIFLFSFRKDDNLYRVWYICSSFLACSLAQIRLYTFDKEHCWRNRHKKRTEKKAATCHCFKCNNISSHPFTWYFKLAQSFINFYLQGSNTWIFIPALLIVKKYHN